MSVIRQKVAAHPLAKRHIGQHFIREKCRCLGHPAGTRYIFLDSNIELVSTLSYANCSLDQKIDLVCKVERIIPSHPR